MSAIVAKVLSASSSCALKEFKLLYNLEDDFQKMNDTVSAIKAAVLDAEAETTNNQIRDWLSKLNDVLYDADDLLDEFSFDDLEREVMRSNYTWQIESHVGFGPRATAGNGAAYFCSIYDLLLLMAMEVRVFVSPSNQIFFRHKMGSKMKEINKRLDRISHDKKNLQSTHPADKKEGSETYSSLRESYSYVREYDVIGREDEKKCIIGNLLDPAAEHVVSVIPIVGFGGLGKTTLAQLVYNDQSVSKHFELKMWVCVSHDFNMKHIAQKMLGRGTTDHPFEQVQQELRNEIRNKRFLLVLDDVWNEKLQLWPQLSGLLTAGGKGSKIIVTTRSDEVAKIMGTEIMGTPPSIFRLRGLDGQRSRELFYQMVFKNGKGPDELEAIGDDIVRKCAGVPLAIKTIGSHLSNLNQRRWLKVRDMKLWMIENVEERIFSILKLSYDYLPLQLKSCFAYCSLFPKDFVFERKTLIQLWAAQGFIQKSNTDESEEDIGHDYFMSLLSRSFFQDVEMDFYGDEIRTCKMHDLMHDLALHVAGDEHIVVSKGKEVNINDKARHLSFGFHLNDQGDVPTSLLKPNKLRTFLLPCKGYCVSLDESFCQSFISNMKCSRVLNFRYFKVKEIPKSVGKLKHLRYLDLSHSNIKMLPQGITNLLMLQTLKLNWCGDLEALPRGINKLVSLRHLELEGTNSLRFMPSGLGQLTCLQTLAKFVVSKDDSARIEELGLLNNLSGSLTIHGLEHVRSDSSVVESTKLLSEKQYLQELYLNWLGSNANELEKVACKDELVLNALEPHRSIKELNIDGFCGKSLPEWIWNLSSLQRLYIWHCVGLTSLPESMGNLSSLQRLDIRHCAGLTSTPESMGNLSSLQRLDIRDCAGLTSLPESMGNLSSLQCLDIRDCAGLTSLPESMGNLPKSMGNLSSLQHLDIWDCAGLTSLPESMGNLSSLQRLDIRHCAGLTSLPESMGNLSSLQGLGIRHCAGLTSLPESMGNLSSLQSLGIRCCAGLTSLPESMGNLSSLQGLAIWGCAGLTSLPESMGNLSSLQRLSIWDCAGLTSLPESMGNLSSLQSLLIRDCAGLTSLPESMGNLSSLRSLEIQHCAGLTSLPESIRNLLSLSTLDVSYCKGLTSLPNRIQNLENLNQLSMRNCPQLIERCKKQEGEDWPKIAHIPRANH